MATVKTVLWEFLLNCRSFISVFNSSFNISSFCSVVNLHVDTKARLSMPPKYYQGFPDLTAILESMTKSTMLNP